MRIVQVSTLYPPDLFSGGTLACHSITKSLKDRGHDVSVYAGSCRAGERAFSERTWEFEGIPVHGINVTAGYAEGVANYRNPLVAERFDRYLSAHRPDVVHFHSIQALGADVLAVPRARGAAAVLTMHDGWFACARQFLYTGAPSHRMCPLDVDPLACDCIPGFDFVARRRHMDAALANVDRIIAVSEPFAAVLRRNGVAPDKLVVCENGVPPATREPRQRSAALRFGYLGGPDALKGVRTIASAMDLIGPDVRLTLHGVDAAAWVALGGTPKDRRVHFAPRVRPEQLSKIMAAIDVLLVPTVAVESFSLVTREAMQHGVPVIASRCVGPEGIVRDGENGLLFDRGDAKGLAAAMRRFMDDPELGRNASEAALATAVRTVEQQVDQIERIYSDVARAPEIAADAPLPRSVLFLGGMEGAPFRYRVTNVADQLESLGVRATARFQLDEEALKLAGEHEIVVLNRIAWDPYTEKIVKRARAAGALLVFGVDDLVFDPDLPIPALRGWPRAAVRHYRRGLRLFRKTFRNCDAFLGSTETLAEAARRAGKPAFVHPNTLSPELIAISSEARRRADESGAPRRSQVKIGYFSGSYAHDADFAVAADAIARVLAQRPNVRLVLGGHVAVPPPLAELMERIERLPFVGWRELPSLLAGIDVNLAPLETPSSFNDAKSCLKWFEAAAVEVPTIASPTIPFREAIRHGDNGFIAGTAAEWESALLALVDDAELRARVGRAARADAVTHHGPEAAKRVAANTFRELLRVRERPFAPLPPPPEHEIEALRKLGIGVGRAALEPRDLAAGPAQLAAGGVTPRLGGNVAAYQPFVPPEGHLARVDFMVGTYGHVHRFDLVLRVVDFVSGVELGRSVVPAEHACDNNWLAFHLSDVPTREGAHLLFIVEAPAASSKRGLSLYCNPAGWPRGDGWAGPLHGIQLTYRTWFRAGAATADRVSELQRRIDLLEARLYRAHARGWVDALATRLPLWRSARRIIEKANEPGQSVPARAVRATIAALTRDSADAHVDQLMERARSTVPYRIGRAVYRKLRSR